MMRAIRDDERAVGMAQCCFCKPNDSNKGQAAWRNENGDLKIACSGHKHLLRDDRQAPHAVRRRLFLGRNWGLNARSTRSF